VGAYWLPIRTPDPAWFRLDAYQDERSGACVVVLTGSIETHHPQVAERRDRVCARFPLREPAEAWPSVAATLVRQGGFVLFRPETPALDAAAGVVLRAHLRGRTRAGAT
jgi:hypothetical protein